METVNRRREDILDNKMQSCQLLALITDCLVFCRWSAGPGHLSDAHCDVDQGEPLRGRVVRAVGPVSRGRRPRQVVAAYFLMRG
jgi:hypothetical protein